MAKCARDRFDDSRKNEITEITIGRLFDVICIMRTYDIYIYILTILNILKHMRSGMHDAKCWEKVAAGRGIWNPFQGGSCAEQTLSQWAVNSSGSLSATCYRNWGMVYVAISFRADALSCFEGRNDYIVGAQTLPKSSLLAHCQFMLKDDCRKYGGK